MFIFLVVGYNIRSFLNGKGLVSGCLISMLVNYLGFVYDFQKHNQEATQVKLTSLVLQNNLPETLLV